MIVIGARTESDGVFEMLPEESDFYDEIDAETGDIWINGAVLEAGVDF